MAPKLDVSTAAPGIVQAIVDLGYEIGRQDLKWGSQEHTDDRWLLILAEEVGEVATLAPEPLDALGPYGCPYVAAALACVGQDAIDQLKHPDLVENSLSPAGLRQKLLQVAAVAVQWAACIGRRRTGNGIGAEAPATTAEAE